MIVKVYDVLGNKELMSFKVRKNATGIVEKIEKEMIKKFNCSIRSMLPSGKIDMATGISHIDYYLWGNDLPCRVINYQVSML